jgi:NADH:ubiquinone oxidoreductase subunit E
VEHGWLPAELQQEIADYIGMPAVAVQEVATFYNMYNTSRWASTRSPSAPTCRVCCRVASALPIT